MGRRFVGKLSADICPQCGGRIFFSSRRRHTRCREVSWARRCVQETGTWGSALNEFAKKTVKCLVVANPANTNCLLLSQAAPSIPKKNFTCLTRLDHNRALTQLALKTKPVSYTHLTLPTILLVQISVVAGALKKKRNTGPLVGAVR
eukprot:TRINITY_DN32988_c0_g1_i1.p1 TRINITY_DN32988_c0_g1~~TRINITY_DN32988_c0_g1_i1.p1  ORF type:complete len:147 (+),score=51.12 TRINITY_DN32988_c0_g1_i1:26-466(+)